MVIIAVPVTKIVGIAAGIFTGSSMLPQLIKIIKEKKASQVSVFMLLILIAGLVLWVWYGFIKKDWPIIITNLFSLVVNLIMMFLRYKYRHKKS